MFALMVFRGLDVALLFRTHMAIGGGFRFNLGIVRLAAFQLGRFGVGQRAAFHALLDAFLLIDIALHIGLHALRGRGIRVADLGIVFLVADFAAHGILFGV